MRPAPQSRSQSQPFRPPIVSLAYSGAWSFATHQLYHLGQSGWELGTLAAFATGGIAIKQLVRSMDDKFKTQAHRRKKRKFKAGMKDHADARFANLEDIENADVLSHKHGLFLGTMKSGKRSYRKIFYDGPCMSIIAAPGNLKTMAHVVPSILNGRDNMIVNDPAGEAFAICRDALVKAGVNVRVLTAFPDKVSEITGCKVIDSGLDVFSQFHPAMAPTSIRTRIQQVAKWVIPGKPHMDEKSEYFHEDAREMFQFFSLKEILAGRKPTLPAIRHHWLQGPAAIHEYADEAIGSAAFSGVYDELGRSLSGMFAGASQQYMGGWGTGKQYLSPYDPSSLIGLHTSGDGFDPRMLKNPRQRTVVYVISTLGMMKTLSPLTSMTLTYLLDMVAEDTQGGYCVAVLDECGSLFLPELAPSLENYRKAHLKCSMIWQDLSGQSEKKYGKAVMRELMAASQIKVAMGVHEPETLEMFSKLCGTKSVDNYQLSDRAMAADSMPDLSPAHNTATVPLMRPEDIALLKNELLVVGAQIHPMILTKLPYWKCAYWKQIAGVSPYYQG